MTEVREVIESQFQELQAMVERAKREVTEILEAEEKQALKQAEGIRVHLEQRCTELKKTQTQVEKLSKNKNDVDFLQVSSRTTSLFSSLIMSLLLNYFEALQRKLKDKMAEG